MASKRNRFVFKWDERQCWILRRWTELTKISSIVGDDTSTDAWGRTKAMPRKKAQQSLLPAGYSSSVVVLLDLALLEHANAPKVSLPMQMK
jgi:hypothetical protein